MFAPHRKMSLVAKASTEVARDPRSPDTCIVPDALRHNPGGRMYLEAFLGVSQKIGDVLHVDLIHAEKDLILDAGV